LTIAHAEGSRGTFKLMSAVAILDVSGAEGAWTEVQALLRHLPLATALHPGESPLELFSASTTNTSQGTSPGPIGGISGQVHQHVGHRMPPPGR
jgi:hypothetical protein